MPAQQSDETVIIGGGLIGLCTALELARSGEPVTVIDRATAGSGASRGNAGEITPLSVLPLAGPGMIREMIGGVFTRRGPLSISPRSLPALMPFGAGFMRACLRSGVESGTRALEQLARGVLDSFDALRQDGIEWEGGGSGFLYTDTDLPRLRASREFAVERARSFALEEPGPVMTGAELRRFEPALRDSIPGGYFAPSERYIDPGRFVESLIDGLRERGVRFVEHARVVGVTSSGDGVRIAIEGRDAVRARRAVVTSGAWTAELLRRSGVRLPITAGKGYSLTVATDRMPRSLVHSTQNRVVAIPMSGRLRIVGIMEFDRTFDRLNRDRLELILDRAGEFLEGLDRSRVTEEWTAPRPMTPSGLPFIGPIPRLPGVIVAAGHNMHGLSLAPLTAAIVGQLVRGEPPTVAGRRLDMQPFRVR